MISFFFSSAKVLFCCKKMNRDFMFISNNILVVFFVMHICFTVIE